MLRQFLLIVHTLSNAQVIWTNTLIFLLSTPTVVDALLVTAFQLLKMLLDTYIIFSLSTRALSDKKGLTASLHT
jgi:hypothetical protein